MSAQDYRGFDINKSARSEKKRPKILGQLFIIFAEVVDKFFDWYTEKRDSETAPNSF